LIAGDIDILLRRSLGRAQLASDCPYLPLPLFFRGVEYRARIRLGPFPLVVPSLLLDNGVVKSFSEQFWIFEVSPSRGEIGISQKQGQKI
jgi:hypothetical protein